MGNMSVPQILEHNFLNPNDYLDRKWLAENGPIPSDVTAIWKAEDHIGSQLKKMIDASGEPAYDSALKLQMRTLLEENMGINSERAKTLVDSGYVGKVTNRPTEKPNFVQAAADAFLAVQYSRERGNAFTKYMLTGDERFKQVADRYAEKENQHNVGTDDWGFFGNQVVSTAKIGSSTLNSIVGGVAITGLTTLAGAIVGGPAGAAAGHGIGKTLASAFVMWDAGSSQAGANLYELSQMTDENGQKIDLESPLAKTIFLVDLLANGAIEVVGMDFLPGYKQLIDAVGPTFTRNAIKTSFKQTMQKYGKEVLEGSLAEGGEEFFQGWISDLSNNLLISMSNSKQGTSFDTKKAEAILGDSLSAFVDTAKGMVTYGMITAGVGNGVRGARMKIESSRNQEDSEGSVTIDSSFLNANRPIRNDDEYKPDEKLPPIRVIQTESGAVPASVEDAKIASFLKFNKKASAVKVVPIEAKVSKGNHDKATKNLAYQLDLQLDENGRFVAEDENQLSNVVSQVQQTLGIISSKQNKDGSTTFSLLDENKETVNFTIGLATSESKLSAIEPDYGTIDTKLQRILKPKDMYLDAEEHEFVKNRVLESLDGNFSDNDIEAGVNSIMIASRALGMSTDELLNHHIQIKFATDDDAKQIGQADARGWLEKPVVAVNGDTIHTIRLTRNADESTIVHETGHVLRKLASADQLASFADVYGGSVGSMWAEDIKENDGEYFLGNQSFETYAEAFDAIRENEERFADDFVAYLMDGVAPNEEMKGLFARMKEFLRSVYHQFKDRLSSETKQAFDKLLMANRPISQGKSFSGNPLFQESAEYQSIVSRYKGTPSWMRAPNGQPTKLTERQWVQVRTPSFKKWFGDWEAAENLRWLMNADPVSILPKMVFQKGDQDNLVDSILTSWKEKVVLHPEIGDIVLDKEGVKSSIGHGLGREKASAFALIPEIIEKGRVISRQSNWKNRGYDTAVIVAPIEMGRVQYVTEVVVVQRPTATKFYLHEVEIKKRLEGAFKTPTEGSAPRTSRLMIARLVAEGKLEASKVVDENGEPLVVYHGTDAAFDVFDSEAKSKTGHPSHKLGFYFTRSKNIAEDFSRDNSDSAGFAFSKNTINRVIPAFLNIRNPEVMTRLKFSNELGVSKHSTKEYGFMRTPEGWYEYKQQLISNQKDGALIEKEARHSVSAEFLDDTFVAFSAQQIKSATNNNGQFSQDNPSIFFQKAADDRYFNALEIGDEDTARKIIDDIARKKGYLSNNDFRMNHKAPNGHDGFSVNLARIEETDLIPDGFWEHPHWYAGDTEMHSFWKVKEALGRLNQNGKAKIRLYRAIPKAIKEDMFRNGDWVTPDRAYAQGEGALIPGGYRIIVHQVPLEHVWWDVNSIAELGYDDGQEYAYKDTKNNRKLFSTILKDHEGNIIPPSKRFNYRSAEVFFQSAPRLGTPEYQNLFRDSNPFFRNPDGTMKKFFHGGATAIEEFDLSRLGLNTGAASADSGFFFTDDFDVATIYSEVASPVERLLELQREASELEEYEVDWDDPESVKKQDQVDERLYEITIETNAIEVKLATEDWENEGIVTSVNLNLVNPMFVENIENDEDTKSAILNNARQEGYDSVVFLDFDDSMGNDLLSNVVAVFDPGKIFVVHDDAETSNIQSESIDGLDYVKHDLGYEWNEDKHREIFSEITRTLDGILTQPGIQYDFDFGDQSTNGSLFVNRPSDEGLLDVQSENRIAHRGYTLFRGWDGHEVSPRSDEDWKKFKKIDFAGYSVKSSNDLAQLFSIYRNPLIEYFHIVFTKGDTIVAHHALSSGLPGRTFAIDKNFPYSIFEMIFKYKSDGYYLLHNHPSGNTEPSLADLEITNRYLYMIPGLKGHIILNHNKYGLIARDGNDKYNEQLVSSGFHEIPARPLLNPETYITPSEIASVAKSLMDNRANLVLYFDARRRIALAEPVEFVNAESIYEKIENNSLTVAAVMTIDEEMYHKVLKDYHVQSRKHGKFLFDIIKADQHGPSFRSALNVGDLHNPRDTWEDLKAKAILGSQDFLFQLSDDRQKELLRNRKYEIQQLVAGHYYIKDELLEEFIGEEWADEEIRFRKVIREFPWVFDAAKKFENVDDYLESLRSDPMYETSEYQWHEEDDQWFRRIFDYSQIPTPDDLDRRFVQQYTTDPKMLISLANKMKNYEDVGIPKQHRTYKQPTFIRRYGAFKGVSTKFLRLTNQSSLTEIALVANMIQSNPRPYRKALQVVEQAESRVMAARGIGGREFIADDFYSAFGEELEDDLKKLKEESEEQTKQRKLNSLPKELQKKTTYEILELDQQNEAVLKNLGEQDSSVAGLSKKLEIAIEISRGLTTRLEATRADLEKSRQAYVQLRAEIKKKEEQLGRRDARVTSLLDKLVQAKSNNTQLEKELNQTQYDLVSQSEWRAFFESLAELRGQRVYKQETAIRNLVSDLQNRRERVNALRDELTKANQENRRLGNALQAAKNREATRKFRQAFKEVQARIIKNSTFNGNTMDAYFEESMSYVNNLFNKDVVSYAGEFPALLKEYMPDWFFGYESIPRGDNRMASWNIDELLAIDAAIQMMVTDARVKKVARDGEIQARRQQIALQHFRQIYFRMPKLQVNASKSVNMMADIAEDVNTTKQKYHNGQEGNLVKKWHSITMSFAHIQRIARLVDGNMEGAMYNLFVRDLWEGYNSEYREIQRRLSALEEKRRKLGFTDQYLALELTSYKAGGATDVTLTREEAIGVYIYSKNKKAMEKLLSHGGNGMSVFDISDIVAKLDKKDIEFGNYLIESIGGDSEYERLKEATYRIYNINLGREEYYFPLRAKGIEVEGSADLITGPTRSSISYIDKGMTVERVHAKYQVDLAVLNTWQDVMRQQEHLMALGQWVKDANYLLGPNGSVGHTISTNFGSTIRQALQDFVNRVAGQKDNARYISKIFNTLLSKASASMISYNASSMLKQTASLAAVLRGGINPVRFFQMMLSPTGPHPQLKNWAAARNLMYELAPDMKSRTFNVEVQRFRNLKNTTQVGRSMKKVTDFGLEHGTGAVDSIVVTRLWWATYMTALDKGVKSDDAVFKASQFIAESQSTTNQMDMSLIQQSENSFFRIITQFRNDAFQHWNQIFFDLPYHLRNKMWVNAAGDLTSVLLAGAIITLATGAFLGGGDEEDWWKRFVRALFPNLLGEFIPFAGEAIATSFNGYSSGGILSLGSDIGNFIREATDEDEDYEALGDRVWDMIASLGTTAGIPTLTPKRIIKAIEEENPWRLIGGYWYRMWEDAQ